MDNISCPQCRSTTILIRIKRRMNLCDECDHQWPIVEETGQGVSNTSTLATQKESDSPEDLSELVLKRFPFPIAWGYKNVVESDNSTWAVNCAFYTYTSVLRLMTLIMFAQFLRSDSSNPQAARAVQHLRVPTLESWFYAMNSLRKYLFQPLSGKDGQFPPFAEDGPFSSALALAVLRFSKLKYNGQQVHGQIRSLRNESAHDPPWHEAECRRRLPEIELCSIWFWP